MSSDNITRSDVDKLAAQILVNLGIINAAALGASLAGAEKFQMLPFAIGLISAVFSQFMWYIDAALEHSFSDGVFSDPLSHLFANIISTILIVGSAFTSGGSIVYGCFYILGFSNIDSLYYSALICGLPFFALLYILVRKAPYKK
jgi:hypothetical protein